jgi:hypothetical protein
MHYFLFGFLAGIAIGGFGFYEYGKVVGAKVSQAVSAVKQAGSDLKKI